MQGSNDIVRGWNLADVLKTGRQTSLASGDLYEAFFFYVRNALGKFCLPTNFEHTGDLLNLPVRLEGEFRCRIF